MKTQTCLKYIFLALLLLQLAPGLCFGAEPISKSCRVEYGRISKCNVEFGGLKISIRDQVISISNGKIEKDISIVPTAGPLDWEKARFVEHGGRFFLEVTLWSKPVGLHGTQELMWMVYEFRNGSVNKKHYAVVQTRYHLGNDGDDDGEEAASFSADFRLEFTAIGVFAVMNGKKKLLPVTPAGAKD